MTALLTRRFWALAAERAIHSFAQGVLAAWLGLGQILDVDEVANLWTAKPWLAGVATAALSLLTSVASAPVGPGDDPSAI